MHDLSLLRAIYKLAKQQDELNPIGLPVFITNLEKETGLTNPQIKSKLQPLFQARLIKGDISGIWVSLEKNSDAILSKI
jgi:hypothetical protein